MLLKLPNRFEAGELADPIKLNENFGYVQAAINGNLDARNLSKATRLTGGVGMTPYNYTPSALTFYFASSSATAPSTAEYQFHDLGSDIVLFSHLEFSAVSDNIAHGFDDGRSAYLMPLSGADQVEFTVTRGGTAIWQTTYDQSATAANTVGAGVYVWPYGQPVNNERQRFVANDVLGVDFSNGAITGAQFIVARVWLLWPQVSMPANSPQTNSLTRELLPSELA